MSPRVVESQRASKVRHRGRLPRSVSGADGRTARLSSRPMRARHLQLLAGITVAGALIRFLTLDVQSYWLDEVATVNLLHRGVADMISGVGSGGATPPGFFRVAWVWGKAFRPRRGRVAFVAALFRTATIPIA